MKNLLTIVSFAILGSILFSSCGSSLTITKRRVNKGFYVASNHNKGITKHVNEKEADRPFNNKAVSEAAISPEEAYAEPVLAEPIASKSADVSMLTADVSAKKPAEPAAAKHKTIRHKIAAAESTKRIIEKMSVSPKKYMQKMKQKSSPQPIADDALSLFWIVVLIIFLLYLVGLLSGGFGLGGLIHLLLVVALILLILWLLGIV
jgi:hypothetical protein